MGSNGFKATEYTGDGAHRASRAPDSAGAVPVPSGGGRETGWCGRGAGLSGPGTFTWLLALHVALRLTPVSYKAPEAIGRMEVMARFPLKGHREDDFRGGSSKAPLAECQARSASSTDDISLSLLCNPRATGLLRKGTILHSLE